MVGTAFTGTVKLRGFAPHALGMSLVPLGILWLNIGGAGGNLEVCDLIYCCHQTFRMQIWHFDTTLTMSAPVPPSDLLLYQSVSLPRVVQRKGWLLCRSIEDIDSKGCALNINCHEHKYWIEDLNLTARGTQFVHNNHLCGDGGLDIVFCYLCLLCNSFLLSGFIQLCLFLCWCG